VKSSKNPIEFTNNFSLLAYNYDSAESFYAKMNCSDAVSKIKVPTLMISAKNDPSNRHDLIPWDNIKANSNIIYLYTPRGGHLEFMSDFYMNRWYKAPMGQFLNAVENYNRNIEA